MLRSIWARGPLAALAFRKPATAVAPGTIVQHVRIKTRGRIRNFAIGASIMYVCWAEYLTSVVGPPLAKHMEEDGAPIFLPFPFTSKVVESRPYKSTDAEWREYVRISRDRALQASIRADMLQAVEGAALRNAVLIQRVGRPMKTWKHWLDVEFPYRPPPKILRDGLLLSPDGLALVSMEIDATTMMRISRALWPTPVAHAVPAFVGSLVRQNVQTVARYFGYDMPDAPPPLDPLAALLKKKLDEADGRHGTTTTTTATSTTTATADAAASSATATKTPTLQVESTPARDAAKPTNAKDLIPFNSLRPSIEDAWLEFRRKLAKKWQPLQPLPPSGCVGISGLVELQAPRGRVLIEVKAFWDPKTRKFDIPTMNLKLRSIRVRRPVSA